MTENAKFASRCRHNAKILRELAQTGTWSESHELLKFADEFDQMGWRATASDQEPLLN